MAAARDLFTRPHRHPALTDEVATEAVSKIGVAALAVLIVTTALAAPLPSTGRTEGVRLVLVGAALLAFGFIIARHRRAPFLTIRTVGVAAVVLLAIAVALPSRQSRDLFSYASYGRLISHYHENPYRVAPAAHPTDPIVRAMAPGWRSARSVYGPVFTGISAAGMAVAGHSALAARLLFQLLAAMAVGLCLLLLWRRTRDPAAVAFVGLNPVIILAVVNGGHNDALVGLALLAAVLAVADGRFVVAGVVLALGTLVKIIGILPLGALVLYLLVRRGWRAALAAGLPSLGLIVVAYAAVGGVDALRPIREGAVRNSRASIWLGLLHLANYVHPRFGTSPSSLQQLQVVAVVIVGLVALITVLSRLGDADPALATATAVVAYTLAAAYVLPWYAGWVLPVLALAWRSRLSALAAVHAALLLFAYEDRPTFRHASALHRFMHGLWAYVIPSLEVVAVVALICVAVSRFSGDQRSRRRLSRSRPRAAAAPRG